MKICFFGHGISIHTKTLTNQLVNHGFDVHVISINNGEGLIGKFHKLDETFKNRYLNYIWNIPKVRKIVGKIKPDIVVGYYVISNGFLSIFSGSKPVVLFASGGDVFNHPRQSRILWWIVRYLLQRADRVVCVANHMRDYIVEEFKISPNKVNAITRGISLEHFRYPLERVYSPHNVKMISTRGYWRHSNYNQLIKAIALIKDAHSDLKLINIGDGEEIYKALELTEKLGVEDSCELMRHLPHGAVISLMHESDIYVSLTYREGCSNTLFEAMAAGAFPMVSDIPANREWINDGVNGFLIPLDDFHYLADKIKEAINDVELRKKAAYLNRKIVEEKADLTKNIGRIIQLLKWVAET